VVDDPQHRKRGGGAVDGISRCDPRASGPTNPLSPLSSSLSLPVSHYLSPLSAAVHWAHSCKQMVPHMYISYAGRVAGKRRASAVSLGLVPGPPFRGP